MGVLHAFYPNINLGYWTEFWIVVGLFLLIGASCAFFIETLWLRISLGLLFLVLILPVTVTIYQIPYMLASADLNEEDMLTVVKEELAKGSKLVAYPLFRG